MRKIKWRQMTAPRPLKDEDDTTRPRSTDV